MGVVATVGQKTELLGSEVVEINARLVIEIGVKQIAAATLAQQEFGAIGIDRKVVVLSFTKCHLSWRAASSAHAVKRG